MKLPLLVLTGLTLIFGSCGKKNATAVNTPSATETCKDTFGTVTFKNTKSTEIKITISAKTSVKEGNTIVNTWKNLTTLSLQVGESKMQILPANTQFMYTVYGPVSTHVNGYGVIGEEKFFVSPCDMSKIDI